MRRAAPVVAGLLAAGLLVTAESVAAPPPPDNDARARSAEVAVPGKAKGTTDGATLEARDPSDCGRIDASVWYRFTAPAEGRIVVRLKAGGDLDAVVAVYRKVRSQLETEDCQGTDRKGNAALAVDVSDPGDFLVLVGQRHGSDAGPFELTVFMSEPPATAPGDPLPATGAHGKLNALGNADDAWSKELVAGTTYRLNLVSLASTCLTLEVFRPGAQSFGNDDPATEVDCEGYSTFTPGPDGGGLYSFRVVADDDGTTAPQGYRLLVGAAGPDDIAPGLPLANDTTARGRIGGLGLDALDLYRFQVDATSDVTLDLKTKAHFDLLVVTDTGRRVRCLCDSGDDRKLRRRLAPGLYYAAVKASGHSGGAYGLRLLIRSITATSVSAPAEASAGSSVGISASISGGAEAGVAVVQIDRFDPLDHWVFLREYRVPVSGGSAQASWTPPAIGRYRARVTYRGTITASPSRSGYALVHVG